MINNINYFKWNKILLFINLGLIILFGIVFFYHIQTISTTKIPPRFMNTLKKTAKRLLVW
jgi:Trk-type K+ transport system membrane component